MVNNSKFGGFVIIIVAVLLLAVAGLVYLTISNKTIPNPIVRGQLENPKYSLQYFTKPQLLDAMSWSDQQSHGGACYLNWNTNDWGYENADCFNAQIEAYDETGDIHYLNEAQTGLDTMFLGVTDCKDMSKVWTAFPKVGINDGLLDFLCIPSAVEDQLYTGTMAQLYAHYVDVVQKHASALANTTHIADAAKYRQLVLHDLLPGIQPTWKEYTVTNSLGQPENRGCYSTRDDVISCQNTNRASHFYDTLLYAYDWTHNQTYADMYTKWARYFKAVVTTNERSDTPFIETYYSWHYHDADPNLGYANQSNLCTADPKAWICNGPLEMFGYANFDIIPVLHGYRDGIFWTSIDMQRFTNTLTKGAGSMKGNIYTTTGTLVATNQSIIYQYGFYPTPGDWSNQFVGTEMTWSWVDMSLVSPDVYKMMEQIGYNEYTYQKTNSGLSIFTNSYYECVADPVNGLNKPICASAQGDNPAWNFYMLVKLYAYAK